MKPTEPSSTVSCPRHLQFQIGRDSHGNWVVQDKRGICGGLFINRVEALRFAMFENGNRPEAVVMVPSTIVSWPRGIRPRTAQTPSRSGERRRSPGS